MSTNANYTSATLTTEIAELRRALSDLTESATFFVDLVESPDHALGSIGALAESATISNLRAAMRRANAKLKE